jgi:hypothetical protein
MRRYISECVVVIIAAALVNVASAQQLDGNAALGVCGATIAPAMATLNYYAEGTITPANVRKSPGAVIYKLKGMGRVRSDFNFPDRQESIVVNKGVGYRTRGSNSMREPLWATDFYLPEFVPQLLCAANLRADFSVIYKGADSVNGRPVYHFEVHETGGQNPTASIDYLTSEVHLYLDQASLQVVKVKTWAFSPETPDNRSVFEIYFDDFRNVSGLWLPFHITHFSSGKKLDDIVLNSVRTDLINPDSDFD